MSVPAPIESRWAIIRQKLNSERLSNIVNASTFEEMSAQKDALARDIEGALFPEISDRPVE